MPKAPDILLARPNSETDRNSLRRTVKSPASSGRGDEDPMMAAGTVGGRIAHVGRLRLARPVGRADLDAVAAGGRRPLNQPLDPRRGGDGPADRSVLPLGVVEPHLDLGDPAVGAHATPATATGPTAMSSPFVGISIRDWVRIGASFAQPRGTQYPSTASRVVSSIERSHLVAET